MGAGIVRDAPRNRRPGAARFARGRPRKTTPSAAAFDLNLMGVATPTIGGTAAAQRGAATSVRADRGASRDRSDTALFHALKPRLIAMLGHAPSLETQEICRRTAGIRPQAMMRRLSAAVALCRARAAGLFGGDEFPQTGIEATVLRWQLSIDARGIPIGRSNLASGWHALIARHVLELVAEHRVWRSPKIVDESLRFIDWVAARSHRSSWREACVIDALATSSAVQRGDSRDEAARERLASLLGRQTDEGWFPEHGDGGVDVLRHTLLLDTLARLATRQEWAEVLPAIDRGVRFLCDTSLANHVPLGVCTSCGTGLVSPVAVSLRSGVHPAGSRLAESAQLAIARFASGDDAHIGDHTLALLAPGISVLAAEPAEPVERSNSHPADHCASGDAPSISKCGPAESNDAAVDAESHEAACVREFAQAGFVKIETAAYAAQVAGVLGGSLQVRFAGGEELIDDGIAIACETHTRSAVRAMPSVQTSPTGLTITTSGLLRRRKHLHVSRARKLVRRAESLSVVRGFIRRIVRMLRSRTKAGAHTFQRTIRFEAKQIVIEDVIHSSKKCHTVLLGAGTAAGAGGVLAQRCGCSAAEPTIVEGGAHLRIRRTFDATGLIEISREELLPPAAG